ncbi:recombinase family protein [Verrucomicrobiaceae bacterium 227]
MNTTSKITNEHTERLAYVYVRQSTMGQVRLNQESTQRQYALKERARILGWPDPKVVVLDRDLGESGAQMSKRGDFQRLIAEVSLGKVGGVLALEASRLSRSCADWHRLLELCALTSTLIIDEDGCYDPRDFNDQLLLGVKGTMSQAELHLIRARLQGGKINKARKGELRFPLPVGFVYNHEGKTILDPDLEVRSAVALFFAKFNECHSAYGAVRAFGQSGLGFPKRAYGGVWDGQLIWGRLTHSRALQLLANPCYAGCYTYGRYGTHKTITESGEIVSKTVCKPREQWQVFIEGHHEGYINWEQYLKNQEILKANCPHGKEPQLSSGAAREGAALLQGLLICGRCGRRITVRYGAHPQYECNWHRREGLSSSGCLSTRGDLIDQRIGERVLEAVEPMQIEIALEAAKQLAQRDEQLQGQWELRLQRAEYESQLAERNYRAVDATNRLVASALEHQWEEALGQLEKLRDEQRTQQEKHSAPISSRTRSELIQLAKDLPRVWQAPSTSNRDRKRLLRLLIKDITVQRTESRELLLHIRWQGGACESLIHQLPPRVCDKWRYPQELIEKIRELAREHCDGRIATELNEAGLRGSKDGRPFTISMIRWIRYKHDIATPSWSHEGELTVEEVAERFKVSRHVVYYWIGRGDLPSRQPYPGGPHCLKITPSIQKELAQKAENARLRLRKLGS